MANSREKGKRGELELAAFLRERGFEARRGQQFSGGSDSPDVVCPAMFGLHLECKRTERLQLYAALTQARDDAGADKIPVVAHRQNGKEWVAILPLDKFLELVSWMN